MSIDIAQAMRVFCAVVEGGSFAAAADRADMSRAMVTRYVAQLEAHLGVRLLNRTTRAQSLTAAGNDYYLRAQQILGLLEDAETSVASESATPKGTLRVTTPSIFGIHHLAPAVAVFAGRHPHIAVDISCSERIVDLVEEGFDLALRITREVAPGLIARRLAPISMVTCASPAYLARHGQPRTPQDLSSHACLFYSGAWYRNEWHYSRGSEQTSVKVNGPLRANTGDVLVRAALDGLGIVSEPSFVVHEALREGRLVRVLPDWSPGQFTLYAVYANRRFMPPKLRVFIDFLAARFGPVPYWEIAEGEPPRAALSQTDQRLT